MGQTAQQPWLKIYDRLGVQTPEFADRPYGSYLEEHARERPDASAMWYVARHISYSEFNAQTNKLANALTAMGIGRGDVIGIHLPNIPQYAFALAAISKMGAIGSGLSPLLAPPELAYQIQDANIKIVITLSDIAPALASMPDTPDCLSTVICTGAADLLAPAAFDLPDVNNAKTVSYLSIIQDASNDFKQVDVNWNDTYMIQYTGGTTGRPKGAMHLRTIRKISTQCYRGRPCAL